MFDGMKRTILVFCLALYTSFAWTQAQFGLKAGLNFANLKKEISDYHKDQGQTKNDNQKYSTMPGFQGGVMLIAPFNDNIGMRAELLLSFRNVEYNFHAAIADSGYVEIGETEQNKSAYLEIPLNLYYGFPVGENQLQLYMGFTTAIGLWGSNTYTRSWGVTNRLTGQPVSADVDEGEDDIIFSRKPTEPSDREENSIYRNPLDFSINIGASFLMSEYFLFSFQYSKGLSNTYAFLEEYISFNRKDQNRLEYRITSISVAYIF